MNNFAAAVAQTAAAVAALIRKSADALLASHKNAEEGIPRPDLPQSLFLLLLPGSPAVSLRILHTMEFRCGRHDSVGRAESLAQIAVCSTLSLDISPNMKQF